SDWFKREDIHGTPTFFINSYELPKKYRIEDITKLMPGLLEQLPFGKQMEEKGQKVSLG
ncbi:MAG: hypothetical protein GVY20_05340, partial [Bacteroidetes bacterium]|nr:hypothetical protein [Bacteroidota bacterium]